MGYQMLCAGPTLRNTNTAHLLLPPAGHFGAFWSHCLLPRVHTDLHTFKVVNQAAAGTAAAGLSPECVYSILWRGCTGRIQLALASRREDSVMKQLEAPDSTLVG